MDSRLLQQELQTYFRDQVQAAEPASGWWANAVARATERRQPSIWHRLSWNQKWLRPALVAIPAAVLVVALLIVQPWVPAIPGFSEVLAKSYIAAGALQSYRTELTLAQSPATGDRTTVELSYAAPDRYYTKKTSDGTVDETVKIGDQAFYRSLIDGTIPQVVSPDSSGLAPDMGKTFSLLNTLHDLKALGIKTIGSVRCYGYRGNLYLPSGSVQVVQIWIGEDDSLPREQTQGDGYVVRFFDFNQPISIEAPVTAGGELQEGWHALQTGPHLSINSSSGIGGADPAHSIVKYDITVSNDGLQTAKDVRVAVRTEATNNQEKPQVLDVAPPSGIYPVDIDSWQSLRYHIEWEFDTAGMSKLEIAQLVQQTVIVVTYHGEDGKEITQTLPAK